MMCTVILTPSIRDPSIQPRGLFIYIASFLVFLYALVKSIAAVIRKLITKVKQKNGV